LKLNVFDTLLQTVGTFAVLTDQPFSDETNKREQSCAHLSALGSQMRREERILKPRFTLSAPRWWRVWNA